MKYSTNDNREAITVSFPILLNVDIIIKRRSQLKKMDKSILPLYSVQLR